MRTSDNALSVLKKRYFKHDKDGNVLENATDMLNRVSKNIAGRDKNKQERYFEVMDKLLFLPNSPTLMNAGNDLQQLSACFVLPVEDSMISIFDAVKNAALIHKSGGGTGFSFSRLREAESPVKSTDGVSSGAISFMKVFDSATNVVKQGGKRRGANMGILEVDHPDIIDFITAKEDDKDLNNFNISVGLTKKFMESVEKNEEYQLISRYNQEPVKSLNARDVFNLIVKMAHKNGEPGIVFIDRINEYNPIPEVASMEATNPCVTGDTLIPTEIGMIRIQDLVEENKLPAITTDMRVPDSNTQQPQKITKLFNNGEKDVFKIITKSGFEIEATADHKFMTNKGWVALQNLSEGDDILIQSSGIFNNDKKLKIDINDKIIGENGKTYSFNFPETWSDILGETLGWLVGDGWIKNDENCRVGFTFGNQDKKLIDYFKQFLNDVYKNEIQENKRENGVYHLSYHSKYFVEFFEKIGVKVLKAGKKQVPTSIFTAPESIIRSFLRGLFSADGTVMEDEKKGNYYVRLSSKSVKLLKEVQILLLNLGIKGKIYDRSRDPRAGQFKYTNKDGEKKSYDSDGILYEINISKSSLRIFQEKIGFLQDRKNKKLDHIVENRLLRNEEMTDEIISIESVGIKTVYDLTEPVTHSFIGNGFVIHNCGEQPLLANEACNLGSVNLALMINQGKIDWDLLKETIYTATEFLDDVIDKSKFPLSQIDETVKSNRKIGLGIMGWADLLVQLGIPYNSDKAIDLAEDVMEFIDYHSKYKSMLLAKEKDSFPNFDKSIYKNGGLKRKSIKQDWDKLIKQIQENGIRNATTTTIAPTGTISMIADTSGGIEPNFSLVYVKNVMDGEKLLYINKYFESVAKEEGFYSKELMQELADKGNLDEFDDIPDEIKQVYVTSHDIPPEWHIKTQAAFQKYVDNAVSKTINFSNTATERDIKKAYEIANDLGCKGLTVYRDGSRSEQVLSVGKKVREQEKTRIAPRKRPKTTIGATKKIDTGCGHLYVTINSDESGVCEVFTQMGKVGGCASAQLEAIGRLISLALRSNVKMESIIKQLSAIRCPNPTWSSGNQVLSCADGIAKALHEFVNQNGDGVKQIYSVEFDDEEDENDENGAKNHTNKKSMSNCPDCGATLEYKEGCKTCPICGWSKCS